MFYGNMARGTHPSGVGIDRYVKYSDLTGEEQDFLKKQAYLSLLNFIDPQIISIHRFKRGNSAGYKSFNWMANLQAGSREIYHLMPMFQ
jgi:hypothetical protein